MSLDEITQAANQPEESFEFEGRQCTITVIAQPHEDGSSRVVVQGFIKARIIGKHVAIDGFYKHPDGSVTPMSETEYYEFD